MADVKALIGMLVLLGYLVDRLLVVTSLSLVQMVRLWALNLFLFALDLSMLPVCVLRDCSMD